MLRQVRASQALHYVAGYFVRQVRVGQGGCCSERGLGRVVAAASRGQGG